jgi:LPXTG-motif cell wall-anchored protein
MAFTSTSRRWSTVARRAFAATAVAGVALVAAAVPASAHNQEVTDSCDGGKIVLTVDLKNYSNNDAAMNTVTVTDGDTMLVDTDGFRSTYNKKFAVDGSVAHDFKIVIFAEDDPNDEKGFSKIIKHPTRAGKCKAEPTSTTTSPTKTESSSPSAEPSSSTAAPATTTTTVVVGANASLASTGASIAVPLTIGALLLLAGATMLLIVRKRRKA